MSDLPPSGALKRIGPYRVLQVLGEGGMGIVYEAEQTEPVRRRVAIKMMQVGADTDEVIGRFHAERQALAVMEHPGIARVFDAGTTEEGRPYFVMELVRGIPLDHHCDQQRLGLRQRVELLIRVCEAVQHAHQKGVIHRDLKPGNVLVTEASGRAEPKIIDFGIAKAPGQWLTDHTVHTQLGQALGTLAYMSPEQAEMSGLDVDTRTDVYALGVILHQLVTGRVPLDPEDVGWAPFLAALIQREAPWPTLSKQLTKLDVGAMAILAEQRDTDPQRLLRTVHGDLQWIVTRAIEKDRERRYETANGLAMDLRRYLDREPVVARPPTALYSLGLFVRRNKAAAVASVLMIMALVLGTAAATMGMLQALSAQRIAAREAETSRQVSNFLVDLFQINDPSEARGNTVTAREVLDAGAARVRTELTDQPEIQARLMQTIGAVYDGLGLWSEAESYLEESLAALREAEGTEEEVAGALDRLAAIRGQQGRIAEAERLQHEALSLRESSPSAARLEIARSQHGLARILIRTGRPDTAVALLADALAARIEARGEDDPLVIETTIDLSDAHLLRGDFPAALEGALSALEATQRAYPSGAHPALGHVWGRVAGARFATGDLAGAEAAHREALAVREVVLEPTHPELMISRLNLGIVLYELGRFSQSEEMVDPVYSAARSILPPHHAYVETASVYKALLALTREPPREALPLAADAYQLMSTTPDPSSPRLMGTADANTLRLFASLAYGRALAGVQNDAEAEPLLRVAVDGLEPEHTPYALDARSALSDLLRRTGRATEAESLRSR